VDTREWDEDYAPEGARLVSIHHAANGGLMPAYKLCVQDNSLGINVNVRYENLERADKPEITTKGPQGQKVKQVRVWKGNVLEKDTVNNKYMDDAGGEYSKDQLTYWMGEQQVSEVSQTKVFNIEGYQPVKNYTDEYVIDTYYEIYACDNSMTKDIDRQRAIQNNLVGMYKLWKHLHDNNVVARGEFCPASRGFTVSDGYIRAIDLNGKWALEIGKFKEAKKFLHAQETVPTESVAQEAPKLARIKMV
jgi:hypothetical protein